MRTDALPDEIAQEWTAVCERLTASENPYFGTARVRESVTPNATPRSHLDRATAALQLGELDLAREVVGELLEGAAGRGDGPPPADTVHQSATWLAGLVALQAAEERNCVQRAEPDACIVPLRSAAKHRDPAEVRRANTYFADAVRQRPGDPLAVWLFQLTRALGGGSADPLSRTLPTLPTIEAASDGASGQRWRNVAGTAFPPTLRHRADLAGGAVVDDFDGDGLLDLITSTWHPCQGMQAMRNRGDGTFEDVSERWGLARQWGGLNLLQTDYDNDGVLDLLLLRGAWLLGEGQIRNSLLRGQRGDDGTFTFEDVTRAVGLAEPARPTQTAAWADIDLDGDLDLYIGNEATANHPFASQLFLNQLQPGGRRRFVDVTEEAGVANYRYAKGVTFGDFDNDGDPDLYVSNFGANRLYRNDGVDPDSKLPRFTDVATELGVTAPELQSFATWWFDFDHDGDLDLFVGDYRSQARAIAASYLYDSRPESGQPLIYRNQLEETGTVGFVEVSRELGLWRPAMPMGANYGDFDNDGFFDVVLGTGEPDLASVLPNQAWRNDEGKFTDVTFDSGLGHLQKGHGLAFGDVDHDGDQDLLHQLGGFYPVDTFPNALFENHTGSGGTRAEDSVPSRWISLELVGTRSNRRAIGARVRITIEGATGPRTLHHVVSSGGSFGASTLRVEAGLGAAAAIRSIEVAWPGGQMQTWPSTSTEVRLPLDEFVRLVEGEATFAVLPYTPFQLAQRGASPPKE